MREKKEKNEKIDEQNILITMVGGHNHMGVFASSAWWASTLLVFI